MSRLADFRLEVYFARWEFKARHHMTASDAETMTIADLVALSDDEDRRAWDSLRLGYTETRGAPNLREAIAATYERLDAGDILCFGGAQEGIWCAMHALLEPDDHVVVTAPNYQSMESVPTEMCGLSNVSGVLLRATESGWALDPDEVRAALRPNTRLIAVNFPNNPTGFVPPKDVWTALLNLCDERGLHLFSDEVYRGLEQNPDKALVQAADAYPRGLSLNVMSKAYGLPGLRLGWIACRDPEVLGRMERIKHYLSICNAGPSEVLARIALKARDRIVARNRSVCVANMGYLKEFFAEHPDWYEWSEPNGGCVAYPKYLGSDGVEEHCRFLVEEHGVLLLPASIYKSEVAPVPTDRFRVGFGRSTMQAGLAAWRDGLAGRPRTASQ